MLVSSMLEYVLLDGRLENSTSGSVSFDLYNKFKLSIKIGIESYPKISIS